MKQTGIALLVITLGFVFLTSWVSAEMAKEGSGEYLGGKNSVVQIVGFSKDRYQVNFEETGVLTKAPENSPFFNATFHSLGTYHANNGKMVGSGVVIYVRPNGDKIFTTMNFEGVPGAGPNSGGAEIVGGTGECEGITGKIEFMPRPKVSPPKKGNYTSIAIAKLSWKIP